MADKSLYLLVYRDEESELACAVEATSKDEADEIAQRMFVEYIKGVGAELYCCTPVSDLHHGWTDNPHYAPSVDVRVQLLDCDKLPPGEYEMSLDSITIDLNEGNRDHPTFTLRVKKTGG